MRSKARTAKTGDRIAERLPLHAPSEAQLRYLRRGLEQAGGRLPLFDQTGREIPRRTIETCVAHGWAEPMGASPARPEWRVYRLTETGYRLLGEAPPAREKPAAH
jgi:hypothetical protein